MKRLVAAAVISLIASSALSCRTPPVPPDEPQAEEPKEEDSAPTDSQEEGEGEVEDEQPSYQDPQGRFSAPIPPNWKIEQHDCASSRGPGSVNDLRNGESPKAA